MPAVVRNSWFLTFRDGSFYAAKRALMAGHEALTSRHKLTDQTALFFAAARKVGKDSEASDKQALALSRSLVERGIAVNHLDNDLKQTALFFAAREGHVLTTKFLLSVGADPNILDLRGQTALFYAVAKGRVETAEALVKGGAGLDFVDVYGRTCMGWATTEALPVLEKERKRRSTCEDQGPVRKRVRQWANEWPNNEPLVGKTIDYAEQDVIKTVPKYAILHSCPEESAAQLRMLEKGLVADHAEMVGNQPWSKDITPQEWCEGLSVGPDHSGTMTNPVDLTKNVISGKCINQFTLPLVETSSRTIVGYVHARRGGAKTRMTIAQLKVEETHTRQGLGGLLIRAAEDHSKGMGWECRTTSITVLKENDFGLVSEIVANDLQLERAIERICDKLSQCAPTAVAKSKIFIQKIGSVPMSLQVHEELAGHIAERMEDPEFEDSIRALLDKATCEGKNLEP